jgi:hypothetical protein
VLLLHFLQLQSVAGVVSAPKYRKAGKVWRNLLDQFQPFCALFGRNKREAGDIATGPRQAGHDADANSVADRCYDDSNRARGLAKGEGGVGSLCYDDIYLSLDQFGGECWQLIEVALREPKLECGVFLRPTYFSERLSEHSDATLEFRIARRD